MKKSNYDSEERLLNFGVGVVKPCSGVKNPMLKTVFDQIARSATSIGANYSEAINAASKQDFRSKIFIAKKEAAESKYWLKVMGRLGDDSDKRDELEREAQEILMILQKIVNTLKKPTKEN